MGDVTPAALEAKNAAETAATTATGAASTATGAASTASTAAAAAADHRVAVEGVVATNDGIMATALADEGSASYGVVSATLALHIDPIQDALDVIPDAIDREAALRPGTRIVPAKVTDTLTKFETGHGFVAFSGTPAATSDDSAEYAIGSQSLQVVTKADGTAASVQNGSMGPYDATGMNLTVTLRIDDCTNVNDVLVYAFSGTSSHAYSWAIPMDGSVNHKWLKSGEYQTITLAWGDAVVTGTPSRTDITGFRLRVGSATGYSVQANWNRIGFAPEASPKTAFSICCDDIYSSTWAALRPILDNYGFPCTVYAIPERATETFVPLNKLHQLEEVNGWEIAGHTLNAFGGMPIADVEAEAIRIRKWLQDNGFRGVDHFAYAGGQFNPAIEEVMRRYYRSARTIAKGTESLPPANPYRLRSTSLTTANTSASVIERINRAQSAGGWYIITFHDIVTTPVTGTEYAAAELDAICAALAATGTPVRTVGDVLTGF